MGTIIHSVVEDMVLLVVDNTDESKLIDFSSDNATEIKDKASDKLKLSTTTTGTCNHILAETIKNLEKQGDAGNAKLLLIK